MKKKVFGWLDAHQLTVEEVSDYNYLETLIVNFEEAEECEFEEEEMINLIFSYQVEFRKKYHV